MGSSKGKTEKAVAQTEDQPKGYAKWIALFFVARFFDRSGFGYMQYLQTVLKMPPVAWQELQNVSVFNYLLTSLACCYLVVVATMGKWIARFGLGYTCVINNSIAGVLFYALGTVGLIEFSLYALTMISLAYFYGFATILANNVIIALAPTSERDRWVGYGAAFQFVNMAVCPFVLIPVMQLETSSVLWNGAYLHACGCSCLLSGLCYLLVKKNFPMPSKKKPMSEETKQALKEYDETGSIRWLPHSEIRKINQELVNAGNPRLTQAFGSFEEDKKDLDRIVALAKEDFPHHSKYLQESIRKWTAGTERDRDELRKMMTGFEELLEWTKQEEVAFANWLIAHLKDCGYLRPGLNPRFWKSCMIQAFPRILEG